MTGKLPPLPGYMDTLYNWPIEIAKLFGITADLMLCIMGAVFIFFVGFFIWDIWWYERN